MPRTHRYVEREYDRNRLEHVRAQRAKNVQSKLAYNEKIYDQNRFSNEASATSGCQVCKYLAECKRNLWAVRHGDGLLYEPLRCFAEHPEYNASECKVRRVVQEVMEL